MIEGADLQLRNSLSYLQLSGLQRETSVHIQYDHTSLFLFLALVKKKITQNNKNQRFKDVRMTMLYICTHNKSEDVINRNSLSLTQVDVCNLGR